MTEVHIMASYSDTVLHLMRQAVRKNQALLPVWNSQLCLEGQKGSGVRKKKVNEGPFT